MEASKPPCTPQVPGSTLGGPPFSSAHPFRAARPRRTPKVGLVGALDRASGRHRHAAVDPARCPTDPRDAPSRTRAVPSEPDLVPAGLAAVAMDRRAAEDDPIPGTGPGCRCAVLLLHPAARVGLARLAGVRAHPVEPGVRARLGRERWVADVLESHMSYPILSLFRSPHDNTSWVTSLGSVLDAATLMLTSVDGEPDERAKLLYGTGVHAVEDLYYYLRLTEREAVIQRDEFESVLEDMKDDGFSIRPVDDAFARFTEKRAKYAPRLDALAVLLAAPPGLWIGDRSYLGARTAH